MMRLGKRERHAKRQVFEAWNGYKQEVIRINFKGPKPKAPSLSRDETAILKGNTVTQGVSIGQRKLSYQKKGSY